MSGARDRQPVPGSGRVRPVAGTLEPGRAADGCGAPDPSPPARPWCFEDVLASAAMALLVLITLGNVVVRYFTDGSFAWTEEISVFAMVMMVFAGVAAACLRDANLRVEIVYDGGTDARRAALRRLSRAASALAFAVLAALFAITAADEIRYGELSSTLDVPRWWFTGPVALLCALAALRALGLRVRRPGRAG